MADLGRLLIVMGVLIAVVGVALTLAPRVPFVGRLPGDIRIERDGFVFYFPIVTSLVLSVLLTLFLRLFGR